MAKRGRPKKAKEVKKEEAPKVEEPVVEDGEETKDSLPPVTEVADVVAAEPEVEPEAAPEPVEEAPEPIKEVVPGRPAGAPDAEHVALEYENAGHRIYKMKGTGGYRRNQKVIIKL